MSDPLGVNRDGDSSLSSKASTLSEADKVCSSLGSSVGSKGRLSAVTEEHMSGIPEGSSMATTDATSSEGAGWRDVDQWMDSGAGPTAPRPGSRHSSTSSTTSLHQRVEEKAKRGSALFKALRTQSDSVDSRQSWGDDNRHSQRTGEGGLPPDLKAEIKMFRDREYAEGHFGKDDKAQSPAKGQSTFKKALNFVKGNTMGLGSRKEKRKPSMAPSVQSGPSQGTASPAFGSSTKAAPQELACTSEADSCIKEGWLTKERQRDHQWWRRYFVLHDGQLSYYKAKLKGYINIGKKCQVSVMENDKVGISDTSGLYFFRVHSGNRGRPLNVAASSEDERREWVDAILTATTQSTESSAAGQHTRHPSGGGGSTFQNFLNPKQSLKPIADRRTSKASTVHDVPSAGKSDKSSLGDSGPDREGWLVKEDPTSKNWRKRYFVLKGTGLWYYETTFKASIFLFNSVVRASQVVQPTLALNLKMEQHGQYPYRFYISSNKRVFNVAADSEGDMMDWIGEISKEIKRANLGDMPGYGDDDDYGHNGDDFVVAGSEAHLEPAPEGEVALVFTDVQSSTSLWEANPEAMSEGLEIHDNVLRDMIACKGGYEVKTEGDAFMVAFSSPVAAVSWCLDVQQQLLQADWPEDLIEMDPAAVKRSPEGQVLFRGLKVRMGVHLGAPSTKQNPITGRMDYFGPMVNRSARVADAAHGGQVLVSKLVWDTIQEHLIVDLQDPDVVDHGLHMLKGLTNSPEVLIELKQRDLAGRDFPPLRTLGHPPAPAAAPAPGSPSEAEAEEEGGHSSEEESTAIANMPPPKEELRRSLPRHSTVCNLPQEYGEGDLNDPHVKALSDMIAAHGMNKVITVTGKSGSGKTALVTLVGVANVLDFPGGVWFAPLSGAKDCKMACTLASGPLGVPLMFGESYQKSIERLGRGIIKRGKTIIILDDIEDGLRESAGEILLQWRSQCPEAVLLVTSREPLRLENEMTLEMVPKKIKLDPSQESADPMTPVTEE